MISFFKKITTSKYIVQDPGDGIGSNHYHCVEIHQSVAQFGYILREIGNRVRMNLQNFMFSDRYHLATSALAHAMGNMGNMGLILWITSFNCCRASLLLLLMNVFLKVRDLYLEAGSTIPGAFQGSILG